MLQGNPGAGRGFRFPAWRRLLRRCGERRRRHAGCNAICGGPAMAGAAIGPRALRQAASVSDRSGAAPDHSERNPPPRSGRGRGIRRGSGLQRHGVRRPLPFMCARRTWSWRHAAQPRGALMHSWARQDAALPRFARSGTRRSRSARCPIDHVRQVPSGAVCFEAPECGDACVHHCFRSGYVEEEFRAVCGIPAP